MIIISPIVQKTPSHFKLNKLLLLSSAVCLFSACSVLTPKTAESVNNYVAEHQYEKALELYAKIPATEQELIDIKQLEKSREAYLTTLIAEAKKAQQQHNFNDASLILEGGKDKLPTDDKLEEAIESLTLAKQIYTDKYQLQYDEEYARFLLKEAPLLEKLAKTQSDKRSFNKHYKKQLSDRQRLSAVLGEHGIIALEAGDIKTASRQLNLAQELQENERWQEALASIKKKSYIKANQRKKSLARKKTATDLKNALASKQHNTLIAQLKQRFDTQLGLIEITNADKTLQELSLKDKDKKHSTWIKESRIKLDQAINAKLATDLQRGKLLYSTGKIDEAIKVWKSAQSYAPNSAELKEHVRRAETFQARYKALTK